MRQDDPDAEWKRKRNRESAKILAQRLVHQERKRREELYRLMDEMGGDPEKEPPPRID